MERVCAAALETACSVRIDSRQLGAALWRADCVPSSFADELLQLQAGHDTVTWVLEEV